MTTGKTTAFTAAAAAKSLQLCPTPCDPIDGSPPGSSIPGILQARILEWAAISFSSSNTLKIDKYNALKQKLLGVLSNFLSEGVPSPQSWRTAATYGQIDGQ